MYKIKKQLKTGFDKNLKYHKMLINYSGQAMGLFVTFL